MCDYQRYRYFSVLSLLQNLKILLPYKRGWAFLK